jgi:DNA-binding NarL/FixJ family response regulator
VLVISAHPEDQWAMRSLQAGAAGYLTKDHSPEQLVHAIRRVARGGKFVSESMAERLAGMVDAGRTRAPHETLSDREFEVLRALGSGMLVKDVAAQLRLSAKTVSTYRTRLLEKMGLRSTADLVRYVVTHDLLK